ncbi:STAS domain-containing protein [Saccharothrix sp. NRRL B-16314]|uniref:STAS domain-containing protein n=1 Tax=Saccharothrix sp. NRRL B-16314 TaxID=1463825 RepID=UPI00068B855B|nr:STAS domain-containing protein [Saccharothrix sp. NRRL B-16314]
MLDEITGAETAHDRLAEEDVEFCSIAGPIDIGTVSAFRTRMAARLDSAPPALVMDLTGVTFVGATGVAALIAANARAEQLGTFFAIVADSRRVLRPLQVTGVDRRLSVYPTLTEAACAVERGVSRIPAQRTAG